MEIHTRRIYDFPTAQDGTRGLVDGLRSRGVASSSPA